MGETISINQRLSDMTDFFLREDKYYPKLDKEQEITLFKLFSDGRIPSDEYGASLSNYKTEHLHYFDLLKACTHNLSEDCYEIDGKHRERAKEILIKSNLRLVVHYAKDQFYKKSCGYRKNIAVYGDLLQEGTVGLMRALDKFEYQRGYKFSTYATWQVRQNIIIHLLTKENVAHLPVDVREAIIVKGQVEGYLIQRLGGEPTEEEVNNLTKEIVGEARFNRTMNALGVVNAVYLDKPLGDENDDLTIGSTLPQTMYNDSDLYVEVMDMKENVRRALGTELTPREEKVLNERFGLADDIDKTLNEIGGSFGVTRERIRQIEAKALAKLRNGECTEQLRELWAD